ncbi:hypothetical protein [Flindersiella endophytica]
MSKDLMKNKDLFVVLARIVALVVALRTLNKTRKEGDRLEQVDGVILLAGAVTSLLIGIRKLRAVAADDKLIDIDLPGKGAGE